VRELRIGEKFPQKACNWKTEMETRPLKEYLGQEYSDCLDFMESHLFHAVGLGGRSAGRMLGHHLHK
jgi:hypothetical protein